MSEQILEVFTFGGFTALSDYLDYLFYGCISITYNIVVFVPKMQNLVPIKRKFFKIEKK